MWSGIKTILSTHNSALTTELSSSDCQVTEDLIIKVQCTNCTATRKNQSMLTKEPVVCYLS